MPSFQIKRNIAGVLSTYIILCYNVQLIHIVFYINLACCAIRKSNFIVVPLEV